jgi:nucleoside-diphosphate-sugar epimerase
VSMVLPRLLGVSGARGLLGQALCKLFASANVQVVPISLRSGMHREEVGERLQTLVELGISNFVHLAWPASSTNGYKHAAENKGAGLLAVDTAELCIQKGLRFYGLGSVAENHVSETPYSQSKVNTRKALQDQISNGRIAWLRPHYLFDNGSWPLFLRESSQTGSVLLQDDTPRDFIHIDDVSGGIAASIENGLVGEVDIASGKLTRPSELLSALGLGFSILQDHNEVQTEVEAVDISKLLNVSWYPNLTLSILEEKHGAE